MPTVAEVMNLSQRTTAAVTSGYVATMETDSITDKKITVVNTTGRTLAAGNVVVVLRVADVHYAVGIVPD